MSTRQCNIATRLFASLLLAFLVFSGAFFALVSRVRAIAPPNIITYQGRLLNTNGVPVSDASATVIFRLYDASSGGSCLWSNSSATCASATARTVTLTDGLFSENLGDTAAATPYAAINDSTFTDNASVYLDVNVNGEAMTPRKRLLAAPYAVNASTIDGFNSTQAGGTSALALVLDSNGNLQLTGSPQGSGVSQGSVYVNPAGGVVAADEVLFGVAVGGTARFTVDGEGDTSLNGDFIVGGTSLVAPFSIDESLNTLRLGDGTSDVNDPTITFYASDASDSGSLSYSDSDIFTFAGGNISHTGLGTLPTGSGASQFDFSSNTTFSGTSGGSLSTLTLYNGGFQNTYSAIEGASTDHYAGAASGTLVLTGSTATVTRGFGLRGVVQNNSTSASLLQAGGYIDAVQGHFIHNATATALSDATAVHGMIESTAGTIASAYAVLGEVGPSTGTITSGFGGRFLNTSAGTTRYGLLAAASGGTTNYAAYFAGAAVQIDDDTTASVPGYAKEAGDLYVMNDFEVDGPNIYLGDGTGEDAITATLGTTTAPAFTVQANALTTGTGLALSRASGGADYDGVLAAITQSNSSATSDATGLLLTNSGGGNSIGMWIRQNTLSAHVANSTGNNALVIDVNETSGSENMILARSDADGTPDTEFRVESDGDLFADGAAYNSGADYAEFFKTRDQSLGDYEIVCQDPATAESVKRCAPGEGRYVMGVVSTNAAFVGNNLSASFDLNNDPNYRMVGMVGQIDTLVNAGEGAIAIGDPLTSSASMAGHGAKSYGPARIVGFALESLASGTGVIRVLVQPQWYGGDVLTNDGSAIVAGEDLVLAPMRTATASTSGDSQDIVVRGSGWDGAAAVTKSMAIRNDVTDGGSSYRLSVVNDAGSQVASIGESGDLAIAGRLFPSDRGTLQASKYIYYDGSNGAGGDFMRTNASGWGSGAYDFAEMFPSVDVLAAGEVVVFADAKETVRRSTGATYDDRIAGVVSTRPGFLAGDNKAGHVPIALAGRVPTYVSAENGPIAIGDPLTTSSKAGYAMKATAPGPIVGYAMESFDGGTGVVVAFIRPSYFDGSAVEAPVAENTVSDLSSVAKLDITGSMNMNGGNIVSVASLTGIGSNWRLLESGDFITRGSLIALVRSFAGEDVETYATLGREHMIELSGTSMLKQGSAKVEFEKIDPAFNGIIATEVPYRVFVTPASGMTGGVYVAERSSEGFTIRDMKNVTGVAVDWLVIAYHKDFAPEPVVEDVITEEDPSTPAEHAAPTDTAVEEAPPEVPAEEPEVEETIAEEPVIEEVPIVEDPDAPVTMPVPEAQPEVVTLETITAPTEDTTLAPATP